MLDVITDGILDAGKGKQITIGSDPWHRWLSAHKKFKIQTAVGSTVTVYKLNGSWVAQKRITGQLRQKRMGSTDAIAAMSWDDLVIVADGLLAQDYEQEKQSRDPDYLREQLTQTQAENERLKADHERAIAILTESLSLKANAGGKIKIKIREALAILGDA
jgi:phage terminase Nu1 subunit (DNA packaging protein)